VSVRQRTHNPKTADEHRELIDVVSRSLWLRRSIAAHRYLNYFRSYSVLWPHGAEARFVRLPRD
jgi:hypothetical protein